MRFSFNDEMRTVLAEARHQAERHGHDFVSSEHIFLGLLAQREGTAARVLQRLDLEPESLRRQVEARLPPATTQPTRRGDLPYTSAAKKVIEATLSEAHRIGGDAIGPEYLLLGLFQEGSGGSREVLHARGLGLEEARREVIAVLRERGAHLPFSGYIETLQPSGWMAPRGYSNGMAARGRMVFVAGQIGWDPATGEIVSDDFAAQTCQALENIAAVLDMGGAAPHHVVRLTWYITDRQAYLDARGEIGAAYRHVFGRHYPAMAVVVVAGLLEPRARVEIEATAVVPE